MKKPRRGIISFTGKDIDEISCTTRQLIFFGSVGSIR
jgi:hypothetical protein